MGNVGIRYPISSTSGPAVSAPKLVALFNTSPSTAVRDLLSVTGVDTVDTIADNSSSTIPNGIFGVALTKPTATTVEVLFTGIVPGYTGLTPGEPVYVSTTGVVTQTPPASGMWQQIGFATTSTDIFVSIMTPLEQV